MILLSDAGNQVFKGICAGLGNKFIGVNFVSVGLARWVVVVFI